MTSIKAIAQVVEKLGYKASQLLARQIDTPDAIPEVERLETELIVRESTASSNPISRAAQSG